MNAAGTARHRRHVPRRRSWRNIRLVRLVKRWRYQSGERLLIRGDNSMKKFVLAVAMAVAAFAVAEGAVAAGGDNRAVVGVAEFTNQSGAAWWRGGVGWELSGMLSNELSSSGLFKVVERAKLESVLEEQNLAASGRVA